MNASPTPDLALYVHWPFCVSKCPYCDFNSHVRDSVDQDLWRRGLLAALAHAATQAKGRPGSIFFGGGTPSLMPPATVAQVLDAAATAWGVAPDIAIKPWASAHAACRERVGPEMELSGVAATSN